MLFLEKKIVHVCICSIILSAFLIVIPQNFFIVMLVMAILLYFSFLINVIKLIYNRKKIVEESKYPTVFLIINVYLSNIIVLTLIAWIIQLLNDGSFNKMQSYFDAFYYTLITFSTVGYGDITPLTVLAKIISMVMIASNFLLLLVFVNLFVMKSKKKEDYLNVAIYQICFLFEEMSSCCGIIDKSNKEKKLCWSEWIDVYIGLLSEIEKNNPDKVAENEKKRTAIQKRNRQCSPGEELTKIPYYYVNGTDQLLIESFSHSCQKVITAIEFLEKNKISLLENENLSENQFFILKKIKDGFYVAGNNYRYGIKNGNEMLNAVRMDLRNDLERLGYNKFNLAKFQGYEIGNNDELIYALMRVDTSDKKEIFWFKLKEIVNELLKV